MDRNEFNRIVLKYLKKQGVSLKKITSIQSGESLDYFDVTDGTHSVTIDTRLLKPYLSQANLLSPKYRIEPSSDKVQLIGFGHGHCVGFCQWGSRGLALDGKSTQEILQYYYPGSLLTSLATESELLTQKPSQKKY